MKTLPFRARKAALILPLAGILMFGCDDDDDNVTNPGTQLPQSQATANVRGYSDSLLRGTVSFLEQGDSLRVDASIFGLTPGMLYAIHVHRNGNCSAPDSAGEHFSSPGEAHGNPTDSLPQHHRGDLPNLQVDGAGVGRLNFMTGDMSLDAGPASIEGLHVIVHSNPDDYTTQPSGDSGGPIACGVIGNPTGGNLPDTTGNKPDTTGTPGTPNPGTPGY